MKICFIGCTHGSHYDIKIPECDILVHTGDSMNSGRYAIELVDFLTWFNRLPIPNKVLIGGNHDGTLEKHPEVLKEFFDNNADSNNIHYLQDSGCEIEGIKFWGSPYTPTFLGWFFMKDRGAAIKAHWNLIPSDTGVLVTHGPPHGVLDQSFIRRSKFGTTGKEHLGCQDLLEAVMRIQPEVHAFSHIHGSGGILHEPFSPTTFVNASSLDEEYCPTRKPIMVEL